MRMPISFCRRATIYDITPYSPTVASTAARKPKNPASIAISCSGSSRSRIIVLKLWNSMPMSGLISPTARFTSEMSPASGAFERIRIVPSA